MVSDNFSRYLYDRKNTDTMLKPVITILLYLFTPMLFGQSLINMKHYSVQDGLSQKKRP